MSRRYPRTDGLLLLSPTAQPDLMPCWGNGGFTFQTVGHAKREQLELSIYSSIYSRFGVEFLSRVLSWWRTHSHWVLDDSKASHEPTEAIMESDWRKVWDLPASSVSLGQAEGRPPVLGFLEIGTPNVYLNGYIHFRSMQNKKWYNFLKNVKIYSLRQWHTESLARWQSACRAWVHEAHGFNPNTARSKVLNLVKESHLFFHLLPSPLCRVISTIYSNVTRELCIRSLSVY